MGFSEVAELIDMKRSFEFWDGCRVVAFDDKDSMYKYGIVWNYDEHSPNINLVLDGEPVQTVRVLRNRCYKIEDWTERKPAKTLGKIDHKQFETAEKAPPPPQYFKRSLPLNADLTFARAAWIWAERHVFRPFEGKTTMNIPKLIHTNYSSGGSIADGIWYSRERTMGFRKAGNRTYIKYFSTVIHEMCHQYNTEVEKLRNAAHGPDFFRVVDYVNDKIDIKVMQLSNCGYDHVAVEDGGKLKDAKGIDVDLTEKSKLKFYVIVMHPQGSDNKINAVRITDDMKGVELVSKLNNSGYVAAMYSAPFKALEVFSSASAYNAKLFNSLLPISGAHIALIAEHGEFVSEASIDVVARYIRLHPEYKTHNYT